VLVSLRLARSQRALGEFAAADALIGGLVAPPVGSGSLALSTVSALATTLDQ
jgi:hypothetical protein